MMVIINPSSPFDPYPQNPWDPMLPYYPPNDPCPDITGTYTITPPPKKWQERHIKDVKKGIFITFKDGEDPIFIATDDECWDKIMEAIKDEPKEKHE